MKEGKHKRKKFKIIDKYSVLIFIVVLFMSIGYAQISDVLLNITGTVEATSQEGVFIADIKCIDENVNNSKIDYYIETTLSSTIVLDSNDTTSSISYEITLYNNSNKEYIFIDTLTDKTDSILYDNENIEFNITGIEKYNTIIAPTQSLKFTIEFKYTEGADVSKNILNSKLNFRFKEKPKLILNNEGQIYTLNDIYPDYTAQEYEFTVSNYYDDTEINAVPIRYIFETTINSPLTAKIYDSTGQEVTSNIIIDGDTQTKTTHTYILKIIWDNSVNSSNYNSPDYANKEFNCNINLKAVAIDEDYLEYEINKQFNINIKTATFNFDVKPTTASLIILNDETNLEMTINNYSTDTNYNKFDTNYDISLEGNSKFSFSIDNTNSTNNVITRKLTGKSKISDTFSVKFMADMDNLDVIENLKLKIVSKFPYVTTIEIPVIIEFPKVIVTLDANGGSVSASNITVYQTKTYADLPTPTYTGHTFNGWYTDKTGGTQITSSTKVTTTSATQTLYARWTSRLLADFVSVGDYVNYPVSYSNVATNSSNTCIANTSYNGWRVLSIDGSGDNKYVRLVTAGVPMTYIHSANSSSGSTSVTALTTNFFSTAINKSTSTNYKFHNCGFVNSSGGSIESISDLKTLFTNKYTQTSSGTPVVKSMTKTDLDNVWGSTTANATYLTSNNLLAIPSQTSGKYASYYLATYNTYNSSQYLWDVYWYSGAIIFTEGEHGIRPVATLNTTVETTGKNNSGVWQLN